MTMTPAGARLIENPISAAPGFQVENVFVLAGIPRVMRAMLDGLDGRLTGGSPRRSRSAKVHLPEGVLAAVRLVKKGKTYALGVETSRETPAYGARSFELFAVGHADGGGEPWGSTRTTFNDDFMFAWLGIGSQIDGLGHAGIDHRFYNGTPLAEVFRPDGLAKFATHELPPIVARGIVLDIAGLRGKAMLEGGAAINRAEIEAAAKRQGVKIERGDVVLLHTGYQTLAARDPKRFLETEPGLGLEGARYLASQRVVAVGADTFGLEVVPPEDPEQVFPVHQELLTKNGIYILENMRTDQLVADEAWEFLFVLGAPRFKGAVQMVINPVAIR